MSIAQKTVLPLGAVVIILNFLFPEAKYPVKEEERENGQLVGVTLSTRTAFAMPIWKAHAAQEKNTGNPFSDTIIMWQATVVRGLAIATGFGLVCYFLLTSPREGKRDPS